MNDVEEYLAQNGHADIAEFVPDLTELIVGANPWENFREWVHCICLITFDLELGQTIEVVYPGDAELTTIERSNICYLAFPDSNSHCSRDTTYHFRTRRHSLAPPRPRDVLRNQKFSRLAPPALHPDLDVLYGFAHFRQQKNPDLPRGYYQKSIVLLTHLPLFGLFSQVVSQIAHGFFNAGEVAIETACQQVDRWPRPVPGDTLTLPLLGSTFCCRIPLRTDIPHRQIFTEFKYQQKQELTVLPAIHETNFYSSMKVVMPHAQLLWELVLIGEPLLIIAPTPTMTSQLVQSLVSLIWPLKCQMDYRPFFTIHDSDFSEVASTQPASPMLLGVTNPFFTKALRHWPHILKVAANSHEKPRRAESEETTRTKGLILYGSAKSFRPLQYSPKLAEEKMIKKITDAKFLDSNKAGLFSEYRPFLGQDKSLVRKLLKVDERSDSVQNATLRRYFLDLTQSFMIPLERYISSLMPLKKHTSPFKSVPQTKPFVVENFLSSMKLTDGLVNCDVKGDFLGLYQRFVRTKTFECWLSQRLQDINYQLRMAHFETLCTMEFSPEFFSGRLQVEVVDLVLKLLDALKAEEKPLKRDRLQNQLNQIMCAVDDELKSVLLSNTDFRQVFERH